MKDDDPLTALIASGEDAQLTFLREDIELCHTFAQLSKTRLKMGLQQSAAQARSHAEKGYASLTYLTTKIQDPVRRAEIYRRLDGLRVALDQLAEIKFGG
jgi:hypothetical protein